MFSESLFETKVKNSSYGKRSMEVLTNRRHGVRQFQGPFLIAKKLSTTFSCVCDASTLTRMDGSHIRSLPNFYGHSSDYHAAQPKRFHFPGLGGRATASETMQQWRQSEILDETRLTIPGTTFCFVTSRQHKSKYKPQRLLVRGSCDGGLNAIVAVHTIPCLLRLESCE
jgi:hypothetical protein